ncbi:class I SAM-dependent methyltransferase [Nakamurella deserti]|uniref:class I SAM-dependent methyltransferase n=1 Tax=Nakamurella deserti TaxID=2164074 RepID=UPI000DBEA031|nr:methyltransferase domain-containing protein [Nakamurella deserti]
MGASGSGGPIPPRPTPRPWPGEADRLAAEAVAAGDPTGWFDRLWSRARDGETTMPWDSREPQPLLAGWTADRPPGWRPASAVVVGCGLGADAEHVAALGVPTVAFDVSATAVELARRRYPRSAVDYRHADLFAPPASWHRAFELVVDVYTVQALPREVRAAATAAVAGLLAPGGRLVLTVFAARPDDDLTAGPPWPLTETDVAAFTDLLEPVTVERLPSERAPGRLFWRAVFRRPAD